MGEEEVAVADENGGLKVEESGEKTSSWPSMRFDVSPYRTHHFFKQFRAARNPNNFLKGLKWSPDGSCFLASSEDNTLSLFYLPQDGGDTNGYGVPIPEEDSYGASLLINEGESVYDFCWYPYMSVSDPLTCVFATSTRDHPIHLWDSTSGELRCTYRAYDAMDEITAAFSVGFNPGGTKIFAGYNSSIRVFDLHRPGRDFGQYSTLQKNKEGQAGILSTLAFSPTNSGMLAVGSYGQTTGIYREDNMELLYVLHGQEGGVTHVQFSKDGNYLYTGGRKDPYILCWDMRKSVETVYKLYRATENTNQRVFFDIEPCGRHLGTGGQDGLVHMYDLQTGNWVSGYQAASDTVNTFSFHPYLPMAATSSGHRRFAIPDDDDEDKNDLQLKADENCVSLWSFYVTSEENNNNYDENDVTSKSHPQNVTGEEEIA
ncbi:PREDICTED: telomerase Cajal body protein 1-like [Camelina sativa]|uniref:Telomerase Cajal body protein 1-like n=1 Tax=Camelina sativa TaxID=90675 RepID=A0ABM0V0N3_CAMSA|nr:PREDICTED: telomerase Cajal body protein 1-like [Camelina sativa]